MGILNNNYILSLVMELVAKVFAHRPPTHSLVDGGKVEETYRVLNRRVRVTVQYADHPTEEKS